MSDCCKSGFRWEGKPTGTETKLADRDAYVVGTNKDAAVLIIHDIFGWTLNNTRLLADHYASEAGVTVYVPDFFGGEIVTTDLLTDPEKAKAFDVGAFLGRNSKEVREPEIFACARALKQDLGFQKVGAVGFCYGGWAVVRLAAKGNNLVDCISTAHPAMITSAEIDAISVPTQICAAEIDEHFPPEQTAYSNATIPSLGVAYDFQYFPGLAHGFATRGDPQAPAQRKGLERAKNAVVYWLAQHLRA